MIISVSIVRGVWIIVRFVLRVVLEIWETIVLVRVGIMITSSLSVFSAIISVMGALMVLKFVMLVVILLEILEIIVFVIVIFTIN